MSDDDDEWTVIEKKSKNKKENKKDVKKPINTDSITKRTRNYSLKTGINFQANRPDDNIDIDKKAEESDDEREEYEKLENPLFWNKFAFVGDITNIVNGILIKYGIFPIDRVMRLYDCFKSLFHYRKESDFYDNFEEIFSNLKRQIIFLSVIPRFTSREYGNGKKLYFIHIRFNWYLMADSTNHFYSSSFLNEFSNYLGFLGEKHTHVPISDSSDDVQENLNNFQNVMKILKDKRKYDKFQPGYVSVDEEYEIINKHKAPYYIPMLQTKNNELIKTCKLNLEDAHSGYGKILGTEEKIYLYNRKNCSKAFNGDVVEIMIFQDTKKEKKKKFKNTIQTNSGRVVSIISSDIRPVNKIFICRIISGTTNLMTPICRTIPVIYVDNRYAINFVKKNNSNLKNHSEQIIGIENIIQTHVKLEFAKDFANKSFVTVKSLHNDLTTEFNKMYYVDCYNCDFIFLVLYRKWDDNNRFPSGEVVGLYTPDVTFGKTLNLIKVSCDIPVIGIDDEMPLQNEIKSIKLKKMTNSRLNFDKNEKENKKLFFSLKYPNKPYNEIAYSFEQMDLDNFVIGVHVVNVSEFIQINDYLDICAQDRFFTYLLPNISRNDLHGMEPDYLLSTAITTEFLSINMENRVDVFSFYFNIDRNNNVEDISSQLSFITESIVLDREIEVNTTDDIINSNLPIYNFLIKIFQFCESERHNRIKHAIPESCFYPNFKYKINQTAFIIDEELKYLTNKKASLYHDFPHIVTLEQFNEWLTGVYEHSSIKFAPILASKVRKLQPKFKNPKKHIMRLSKQFLEIILKNIEINLFKCESLFPDIGIYHRKWKLLTSIDIKESLIPETTVVLSITNPLSCYLDIVAQRSLQSEQSYENIFEQYKKFEILFEKYWNICKAYEVKHQFNGASFILDCVFDSFTEERIFLHHPFLNEVNHENFLNFQSLNLNKVPTVTSSDGIQSVTLIWKTRIFCQDEEPLKDNIITLEDIYSFECNIWRYDVVNSDINDVDIEEINEILNDDKYPYKLTSEIIKTIDPMLTLQYPLKDRQIMRIQFNYDYSSGIMKIIPELLIINPDFRICLCHRNDPFKYFLHPQELSNINYMRFREVEEYINQFIILNRIEGIYQTIHDSESFFIQDLKIDWIAMQRSDLQEDIYGIIIMKEIWCKARFLKFIHKNTRIYDPVVALGEAIDKNNMSYLLCIQSFIENKSVYWVGHCRLANTCLIKNENNVNLRNRTQNNEIHLTIKLVHSSFPMIPSSEQKYSIEFMKTPISSKIFEISLKSLRNDSFVQQVALNNANFETSTTNLMFDINIINSHIVHMVEINSAQLQAFQKSINFKLSFIWGPPGTGKTMLGCMIAFHYSFINISSSVLYCGPSNQSVNVVAEKLMKMFGDNCPKLLRIFNTHVMNFDFPYAGAQKDEFCGCPENLKNIALHYIIRRPGKTYSEKILELDEKLSRHTMRNQTERLEYAILLKSYDKILQKAFEDELKNGNYQIVLTTAASSCKNLLEPLTFSQVIIDECGMCTEPEAIGPMLNKKDLKNIVLIGDHKQLRPIVTCRVASGKQLNRSLFERLYKPGRRNCTMLDVQYRMHPSICEFPSTRFYRNFGPHNNTVYLKTARCESWTGIPANIIQNSTDFNGLQYMGLLSSYQTTLIDNNINIADDFWREGGRRLSNFTCYPYHINFQESPVYEKILFINNIGTEINQEVSCSTGGSQSKGNIFEAEVVKLIYKKLITRIIPISLASQSILVITQYRLQEFLLKEICETILIESDRTGPPRVSTVVKSQGSECDYVIFSTVRSLPNPKDIDENPSSGWISKYLGFITDENQVNVALTRAKKGLFIIGNSHLLSVHPLWKDLIQNLKDRNCYVDDILCFY